MVRLASVGLAVAVLAAPAAAGSRDPDPATVDRIASDALAAWRVPGLAVVIARADGGELVRGYGVKKVGEPAAVTPDTVFPLASCTKAVTTALIAALADDGQLGWDDPVRKYLPAFHLSDPHADALVTLRDLLSHRTGVRGHDLLWYRAPWDQAEVLRRATRLPVDRPFRGGYEYSTVMVMAAAAAACNRAGRPWDELVRDRLTGPLGMDAVTFRTTDPRFLAADRATGHRLNKDGKPEPCDWYPTPEPNPAGSINLPPRAMVPWLRFQLNDGRHAGRRLVSAENLRETRTPQTLLPMTASLRRQHPDTVQLAYGMGWLSYDYRGRRVVAHGGMIDGFRVHVALLPDDGVGFALFNNLHDTRMNQAVANALTDHLLGLPAKDWNAIGLAAAKADRDERAAETAARLRARRADIRPSLPLDRYAGGYTEAAYGTARVTHADGRLAVEWSSFRSPLEHWEGDVFRLTDGFLADELIEFRARPAGPDAMRFLGQVFARD
jgi:CubicO group peptidase (beta-lactamase class C family)